MKQGKSVIISLKTVYTSFIQSILFSLIPTLVDAHHFIILIPTIFTTMTAFTPGLKLIIRIDY